MHLCVEHACKRIYGSGGSFTRQNANIEVGLNNKYGLNQTIETYYHKIANFKATIGVGGTFGDNACVN